MISPDDLRIPVDPEGMKGPGSSKCHGFLGRGLVFLEDPGGMSIKFRKFLMLKDQPVL